MSPTGLYCSCLSHNTLMVANVAVEGEVMQRLVGLAVFIVVSHQRYNRHVNYSRSATDIIGQLYFD